MKKFIKRLLPTVLSVILILNIQAQSLEDRETAANKKFYFGTSFGLGIMNPKEVNKYLYEYYTDDGYDIEETTANIRLFGEVKFTMSYFVVENLEIIGAYTAAAGWSSVDDVDMIGMQNDKLNILLKLSPSLCANYHHNLSRLNSVYVGGGIAYNKIILNAKTDKNTFKGKAPGLKINLGFLSKSTKNPRYIEIEYNLAKTDAKHKDPLYYEPMIDSPKKLSFTGTNINFGIKF